MQQMNTVYLWFSPDKDTLDIKNCFLNISYKLLMYTKIDAV